MANLEYNKTYIDIKIRKHLDGVGTNLFLLSLPQFRIKNGFSHKDIDDLKWLRDCITMDLTSMIEVLENEKESK